MKLFFYYFHSTKWFSCCCTPTDRLHQKKSSLKCTMFNGKLLFHSCRHTTARRQNMCWIWMLQCRIVKSNVEIFETAQNISRDKISSNIFIQNILFYFFHFFVSSIAILNFHVPNIKWNVCILHMVMHGRLICSWQFNDFLVLSVGMGKCSWAYNRRRLTFVHHWIE